MVPQENHLTFHNQVKALARVGAVSHDIAQAIDLGDVVFLNIFEDGLEPLEIAVNIADDRLHA
jgi:hypothetical protein